MVEQYGKLWYRVPCRTLPLGLWTAPKLKDHLKGEEENVNSTDSEGTDLVRGYVQNREEQAQLP